VGKQRVPNRRLFAARNARLSPSGSGRPMSRQELADACNVELAAMYAKDGRKQRWAGLTDKMIGTYERGEVRWPTEDYRRALCAVLGADERELGLYIDRSTEPHLERSGTDAGRGWDEDVRRRDLLPLTAAAAGMSLLGDVTKALLGDMTASESTPPLTTGALVQETMVAKKLYQACAYDRLGIHLPPLLAGLAAAQHEAASRRLPRIYEAAAAAYHVVASLLLKNGDHPMALLAAERSIQHARASSDPVTIAASTRIMAHALARNGHTQHAIAVAQRAAQQLERDHSLTSPDAASVYGALLLQAAVAAARLDDRDTASTLLDEGKRAAARLGHDGNHQWTGFGPTNVLVHRVNVALTLGDAGTAVNLAHTIDVGRVQIIERKVSLYLDIAQAYTQWGRHTHALTALHTAYDIAPQEIRTRPTARRIVTDLIHYSGGSTRADAMRFAETVRLPV
jgi:transcriptional regulator with XRE-family HTH domain/tetratricopeptide (TPR) repeat protein